MDLIIVGANKLGEYIVKNYAQFGLRHKILGFVDESHSLEGKKLAGLPVLGQPETVLAKNKMAVVLALPSIYEKVGMVRKLASNTHLEYPNLISMGSWISRDCIFGKGNVILEGSLINFGTMIGNFNFLGEKCSIGHESVIGDYCYLENEVNIGGYSILEGLVTMRKGSALHQGVRVGKESVVEKFAEITEDLHPNSLVKK
jgi:UDP-3-O-[3-hydroxymyristoyl] glucosamine N-acyltransferase